MTSIFSSPDGGFFGQIVIGNTAKFLGKRATETATHEWVCYVEGKNGADISKWVARVDFKLHDSFEEPLKGVFLVESAVCIA